MEAILMSINARHNRNIESGLKTSELRTRPPKLKPPFKVYTYESGADGRNRIVNEWICDSMTTWRMCMGIPAHLPKVACVSGSEICAYSKQGEKDITEMHISELKVYEEPKYLTDFYKRGKHEACKYGRRTCLWLQLTDFCRNCEYDIRRPPQNWCHVEERSVKR